MKQSRGSSSQPSAAITQVLPGLTLRAVFRISPPKNRKDPLPLVSSGHQGRECTGILPAADWVAPPAKAKGTATNEKQGLALTAREGLHVSTHAHKTAYAWRERVPTAFLASI